MNNLECRKQGFNKLVCKMTGKEIKLCDCINCPYKKYKNAQYNIKKCEKITKMHNKSQNTVQIKKRTNKLAKMERDRFSLFTEDLDHCIFCGKRKDNLHEVIFGKNRLNSIKYGLVIPVCYEHHLECHKNSQLQENWKIKAQEVFEKKYTDVEFIKIFGKNYIKKEL